jgi:hypothetical protein
MGFFESLPSKILSKLVVASITPEELAVAGPNFYDYTQNSSKKQSKFKN